jgi:hypothetical protein
MKSELISPAMEQRAKAVKKGPTNSTIKNSTHAYTWHPKTPSPTKIRSNWKIVVQF